MATVMEEIDVQVGDEIITVLMPEGTPDIEAQAFAEQRANDPLDEAAPNRPSGVLDVPRTGAFPTTTPSDFSQDKVLEALDLGKEEAPLDARLKIGLGLGDAAGIKDVLEQKFGKPVEVKNDNVVGPVFRIQGEEKFRPVNRGDSGVGDLAAAVPEIVQSALEVGGATVAFIKTGGPAGAPISIPAAIGAEALAAWTTELAKLEIARKLGQKSITDEDMFRSALARSGFVLALGPLGPVMNNIFRRVTGRQMPGDILRIEQELKTDLAKNIEVAQKADAEFNQMFGTDKRSTLGEATQSRAILAGEEASTKRTVGSPVSELDKQNNEAVKKALDDTFGSVRATLPEEDILAGDAVRDIAERRSFQEAADAAQATEQGIESATAAKRAAFDEAAVPTVAARETRELAISAREKLLAPLRNRYTEIGERGQGVRVELNESRAHAIKTQRELGETIIKSIVKEPKDLVDEVARAGVSIKDLFGEIKPGRHGIVPTRVTKPVSLRAVQSTISNINETLRRSDLTPKQRKVMVGVSSALRRDRNRALRDQDPELLAEILDVDAQFRNLKSQYERGVIGRLLKRKTEREGGGGFLVKDDAVIPGLVNQPADAELAIQILKESGTAGERAINALRKGVLGHISENPTVFARRERSMKALLSDRQFKAVKDARNKSDTVDALQRQEKRTIQLINRSTDAKIADIDDVPNLVGKFIADKDFVKFRRARQLLVKNAPERVGEYDGAFKRILMDTLSPDGAPPTSRTLDLILNPKAGQNIRPFVDEVFGKEYLPKLRVIRNAVAGRRGELIERTGQEQGQTTVNDLVEMFSDKSSLAGVFRFSRVAAPPLSVRGRALTAVLGIGRENAQRDLVNAFVNPQKLDALSKIAKRGKWDSFVASQFSIIGMGYINDIRELVNRAIPDAVFEGEQ